MNMKLSFSTLGCPEWSFEQVVSQAKALGVTGIEIRGIGEALRNEDIDALKPENQAHTQQLLADAGLSICALGTSATAQAYDTLPAAVAEAKAALAICNRMGIPGIRVFGDARPVDGATPLAWEPIVAGLRMMCDAAAEMGAAQVWLEVHGAVNTIEILTPILARLGDHPAFGVVWDIQHSYRTVKNDFMPFYQLLKPTIKHMHIKDGVEVPDGFRITLPGEGDIAIGDIMKQLIKDGYDGFFSFEWEKRWHRDLPEPEVAFPRYMQCIQGLVD